MTSPPLSGSLGLPKGKIQSDAHPINYICKVAFCWGLVGVCREKAGFFSRRVGFFCPRSPLHFRNHDVIMRLRLRLSCRAAEKSGRKVNAFMRSDGGADRNSHWRTMTQTELNVATTCITALASQPNSDEKIKLLLLNLFDSYSESEKRTKTEGRSASVSITFTKSEVSKMAKTFKTEFIANGLAAHVLKRQNSKNSVIYEIRYRRGGYYIHVSAATLEKAKAAFLRETLPENIDKHRRKNNPTKNSFTAVAREWLEFKKDKLHIHTYKNYESYCNRFLFPALGNVPIAEIKTIDIHKILPESGYRLYEDLRIVLNSIFKYALACGFISHNPMLPIPFKKAERVNRRPLSSDELHKLIQRLNEPEFASYKQFFFILLFFGLRPCELADARFEGNFLVTRNAKRKNGKLNTKKSLSALRQRNFSIFPLLSLVPTPPTA